MEPSSSFPSDSGACKVSAENLNQVLADTITLRDMYKKHHWQVAGPTFSQLHLLYGKHAVMLSQRSSSGAIECLPAHPHEGAVSIPQGTGARVIAIGRSILTGREFNLAVAFERDGSRGRAVADSSFHHFLDYNFDPSWGCPSFARINRFK